VRAPGDGLDGCLVMADLVARSGVHVVPHVEDVVIAS
jgi:hypothetical protein